MAVCRCWLEVMLCSILMGASSTPQQSWSISLQTCAFGGALLSCACQLTAFCVWPVLIQSSRTSLQMCASDGALNVLPLSLHCNLLWARTCAVLVNTTAEIFVWSGIFALLSLYYCCAICSLFCMSWACADSIMLQLCHCWLVLHLRPGKCWSTWLRHAV